MENDAARELRALLAEPKASVLNRERHALDRLLRSIDGRVVLSGAGGLGSQAFDCLQTIGVRPLAFSDNNPAVWGREIKGVRVLSPVDAAAEFGSSALFLVTIWNPSHWFTETRRLLEGLGCSWISPASPLYWRFHERLLPFYTQDLPEKMIDQEGEIVQVASIWSDDESAAEYVRQIKWRFSGEWAFREGKAMIATFRGILSCLAPRRSSSIAVHSTETPCALT